MRVLIDHAGGPLGDVDDERLRTLYEPPRLPWLRVNMVSTVDGAATGAGGLTGSINNPADKRVFHLLRSTSDAVVVGAGTARAERYGPAVVPIVLVSRVGVVPEKLRGAPSGRVLLATCATASGLSNSRRQLGDENVLVVGSESVDLVSMRHALADRGFQNVLSEGGPQLLAAMLAAGVIDELCVTVVPQAVSGSHRRITDGPDVDVPLELATLLEEDGTLLGRWLVRGG
ncbi:MAG TPA: dihydrofolate reductase family protein [Marmoricola sp.]|nr:dihydrofolate reductase family protein [Marmoricola sp.]